jgi:hypothetical protein
LKQRHQILFLLSLLSAITYLDRVCISVAGPRIQHALHLSPVQWGWVGGVFSISYALFEIPSGYSGDRIGARAVLSRIVLWRSGFTALTGLAWNYPSLLITRFLFGVGEAGAGPNASLSISRAVGIAASADGKRLAFVKYSGQGSVYLADLGPNGTLLHAPVRLTLNDSANALLDWAADNSSVLFESDRNGSQQIFRQSLASDNAEIIEAGVSNPGIEVLSPDGAWVLFSSEHGPGPQTVDIRRVPIAGGSSEVIATAHSGNFGANLIRCSRAPASLCAIAERPYDRKQLIFTELDPLKGRGKELLRFDTDPTGIYQWALSPDGTRIAVMNPPEGKVHMLHLEGRPTEEIVVKNLNLGDALDWASDGKGLFIDNSTPRGMALTYLDLRGNTHPIWEQRGIVDPRGGSSIWGIASRDGRHLAIHGWTQNSNVWMLEGF